MTSRTEPVFIVGTGRCGSTLLSNLIREHPDVLSVSEFFSFVTDLGSLIAEAFHEGECDADRFWKLIATPHARQNMMIRHDVAMDEVLYPFRGGGRFNAETGIPAISQTMLPHLTDRPDALFAELETFIRGLDPAPLPQQYLRLFGWLQQRFGKRTWVERSGGTLRIVRRLHQAFPDAKILHIVRDGRNCAISMSRHYGFRMVLLLYQLMEVLGVDPYTNSDRTWAQDLSDELYALLPENFEKASFENYEVHTSLCGHYWSGEIMAGLEELKRIPAGHVCTLRYEDFLGNPEPTLRTFIEFIGPQYLSEAWLRQARARIGRGRSAWTALPAQERTLLEQACRPGFEALKAHGISTEFL